jgi:hypothetical protein
MPMLVGIGFIVFAAVIILSLVGKIFSTIYESVKTTDEKPVEQYVKILELTQDLKEKNPELVTAVKNSGVAEANDIDQFGLIKMLKAQKEQKKEKNRTFISILMTFMLGVFTTVAISGVAFTLWLFW